MKKTILATIAATLMTATISHANSVDASWETSKNMASGFAEAVGQSSKDLWDVSSAME